MLESRFSERLRHIREVMGLSQADIAERIGVSREQVSKWENGHNTPPLKRMSAVYRALGVTESQFWDESWSGESVAEMSSIKNTGRLLVPGPYLEVHTNEEGMALDCPRCGATDFSPQAVYCRGCAFPLYNLCTAPFDQRHRNRPDAEFCEFCARPTFWSLEYVTLDEILGKSDVRKPRSGVEERSTT